MNAPGTIAIALDGTERQVPAGTTLASLLAELGHRPEAVATAVNGRFVARGLRAGLTLQAGDAVALFQPISGG